jgi:ribosomal RNA-processing protein 1
MLKLLAVDRSARDKAFELLRKYLNSGRDFSELELLKLWKGLFFCKICISLTKFFSFLFFFFWEAFLFLLLGMWHSDRPLTQQRLALSFAGLVSTLRESLFLPFLAAFWTTITTNYADIDSLRLNKFLFLIRAYINAAFAYLNVRAWLDELTSGYLEIIGNILLEAQGKVSDGLRYHILDVWVDELEKVDERRTAPISTVMDLIVQVKAKGRTKVLRQHAGEALDDDRLTDWANAGTQKGEITTETGNGDDDNDEWEGLGD